MRILLFYPPIIFTSPITWFLLGNIIAIYSVISLALLAIIVLFYKEKP